MNLELSEQEIELYSRALLVSGWGLKQQLALKNSIVILNYQDDLLALYLAGAGVGEIVYQKNVERIKELNPNVTVIKNIKNTKRVDNIKEKRSYEIALKNHDSKHAFIAVEKKDSPIKTALLTAIKCINIIAN